MIKKEKLLTPGNAVLGIIIIALIGSLFFDFFGGGADEPIGCPREIENLIFTNVVFAADGVPIFDGRLIKDEDKPGVKYTVSALLRNVGDEEIVISSLGLTLFNLGPLDLVDVEDIVLSANSLKSVEFQVPLGSYHKIDLYTDSACDGTTIWHEPGAGSKFAWELEAEENSTTNQTEQDLLE